MAGGIDAVRFWYGFTDYRHNELGLADPLDPATDGVRQTFTNKEHEGRVEVQLMPFDLRFAQLTTALGLQAGQPGTDRAGRYPGPVQRSVGPERQPARRRLHLQRVQVLRVDQGAGRGPHRACAAQRHDAGFSRRLPARRQPARRHARAIRNSRPKSISVGLIQNLPWDLVASITAQRVERAPKPAELFSRGPHDATATFDIGNPNLTIEVANSVEVGLRRATGPLRFEATAYYTRFSGFIFRRLTGVMCDEDFDSCGNPAGELNQAVYSQRDAIFRGGEFQAQYDVAKVLNGVWGVEGPVRRGARDLHRRHQRAAHPADAARRRRVLSRRQLARARQPDPRVRRRTMSRANETPTAGYNLLKAEISYTQKLASARPGEPREFTLRRRRQQSAQRGHPQHVSYTKNEVLMPGPACGRSRM